MNIDEQIAVLQAFRDGKKIQSKFKKDKIWADCKEPVWDFCNIEYREKPTLKVLYINLPENKNKPYANMGYSYKTKRAAAENADDHTETFEFVELTDEVKSILAAKGLI